MKRRLFVLLIFGLCAFPQNTRVIELSKDDAALLKRYYQAKQKADADLEAMDKYLGGKYLPDSIRPATLGYSTDFRFIVLPGSETGSEDK